MEVSPEIIDLELSFENLKLTREQLVDVAILMGTDFNPGVDGIGPKRGLKFLQKYGSAEAVLSEIGKEITNLDEVRELFLNHPVIDFEPEWILPQRDAIMDYLCHDFSFNKPRVEKALDKYLEAKPRARQFTLGDF